MSTPYLKTLFKPRVLIPGITAIAVFIVGRKHSQNEGNPRGRQLIKNKTSMAILGLFLISFSISVAYYNVYIGDWKEAYQMGIDEGFDPRTMKVGTF